MTMKCSCQRLDMNKVLFQAFPVNFQVRLIYNDIQVGLQSSTVHRSSIAVDVIFVEVVSYAVDL